MIYGNIDLQIPENIKPNQGSTRQCHIMKFTHSTPARGSNPAMLMNSVSMQKLQGTGAHLLK